LLYSNYVLFDYLCAAKNVFRKKYSDMAHKLFAEFPPVTAEQWKEVIVQDLKGADYDKKLIWKTTEGVNVRPYYTADDLNELEHVTFAPGEFPYVRGVKTDNDWKIAQTVYPDSRGVEADNALILETLMKGVNSLIYKVKDELSDEAFDTLLKNVALPCIEINFDACLRTAPKTLQQLAAKVKAEKWGKTKIEGSINCDPLKRLTLKGSFGKMTEKEVFAKLKTIVDAAKSLPEIRVIGVNAQIFNNAGSTIVQELAYGLAMGSEYMSQLTELGLSADEVASRIKFTFAISSNYFMEIAKFRAARLLWAEIVKSYGGSEQAAGMKIHAVTSGWNQTVYDPYVNMLRNTTESMSAALAGVDSLEVTPFDAPYNDSNEFSRRMSRNTQLILKEESHFDAVTDPAAGSYYIENLTASIANEAWKLFADTEEKGGYTASLKAGVIQEAVSASAQKKNLNIATRRETVLGSNQYPNFTEKLSAEIIAKQTAAQPKGHCCCCLSNEPAPVSVLPIKIYRGASAFEELRMTTEKSGKPPKAFMLTFGNLAMCRARAQFSSNFFACAGFEVVDNNRFATTDEGVEAALKAGAEIVVACSSDEEYATGVPAIAAKLDGKAILVVAGDPACRAELEAQSITHFISIRSNVLETLKAYQKELGIA
jgi:methylmalonyl-CoA mutase